MAFTQSPSVSNNPTRFLPTILFLQCFEFHVSYWPACVSSFMLLVAGWWDPYWPACVSPASPPPNTASPFTSSSSGHNRVSIFGHKLWSFKTAFQFFFILWQEIEVRQHQFIVPVKFHLTCFYNRIHLLTSEKEIKLSFQQIYYQITSWGKWPYYVNQNFIIWQSCNVWAQIDSLSNYEVLFYWYCLTIPIHNPTKMLRN